MSCRRFPDYLQSAYQDVLGWLGSQVAAQGFADLDHRKTSRMLSQPTLLSAGAQFRVLFPAHYFKVVDTLQEVIGANQLSTWFAHTPHMCLLDIGCGAGTASAGFVEALLTLRGTSAVTGSVLCLAVDVNHYALVMYDKLMTAIGKYSVGSGLTVDYQLFREGIPAAIPPMIQFLSDRRREWAQPSLAHVIVMQVNVASPLGGDDTIRREQQEGLIGMGVSEDRIAALTTAFGQTEALAYTQVLEAVPVDHLHVVTISTSTPGYLLEERVREMADTLERTLAAGGHVVDRHWQGNRQVAFENPRGSYWRDKAGPTHSTTFYTDVSTGSNISLRRDSDWGGVVALDNLRLAWARTRRAFLEQSILDEVELRLFEHDLDGNLTRLQEQLHAYASDVARTDGRLGYVVPKGPSSARVRGLSRTEEEILSAAIIQKLGHKLSALRGSSYAYRVVPTQDDYVTEYLYEPWFQGYMRFMDEARAEAQRHVGCVVIKADIRNFFARIVRDRLLGLTGRELTESDRVRWLLRLLFSEDLDRHEAGRGIVQGNLASGFYANIYLTDLDVCFGTNNPWGVKFFRYVDDMILVVPGQDDVPEVVRELRKELRKLRLELNIEKTRIYDQVSDFLDDTAPETSLEELNVRFGEVTNALWICCESYRSAFRQAYWTGGEPWWYLVELYQACLSNLGVFVSATVLSRRIYRYLFNDRRCREDLGPHGELTLPALPTTRSASALMGWADQFRRSNAHWIEESTALASRLAILVRASWGQVRDDAGVDEASKRRLERRIRFGVNRLAQLGYAGIARDLSEILVSRPDIMREPGPVVQMLASQGFSGEISQVLSHYADQKDEIGEYMTAILLRAVRHLPDLDADLWKSVVERATKGKGIDALVSSETWLFLLDRGSKYVTPQDVAEVRSALDNESQLDVRLAKNYMLILGAYDPCHIANVAWRDHDLLSSARPLASRDGVAELTRYHEPEVVRQTYYSGRRLHGPEYTGDVDASY